MNRHFTFQETVAAVVDLSDDQLTRYVRVGVITPVQSDQGPMFRDIDLARLELLVNLVEGYELGDDALGLVMSLVDQLNALRGDMRAMLDAVAQEPPETRARLSATIREVHVVVRD